MLATGATRDGTSVAAIQELFSAGKRVLGQEATVHA